MLINGKYQIELDKLKETFDTYGIFFSYAGPISQGLVDEISFLIKAKIQNESTSSMAIRVIVIFVEQIQNVMNYSASRKIYEIDEKKELGDGICIIGEENENYYVLCGNLIDNNKVNNLKEKIDMLNKMDKEELKQYYKQQRRKQPPMDSKGAGLGLIDLARKAKMPLEYNIKGQNDTLSFFSLKVII